MLKDKELIKEISKGYCKNKENLCLAIGVISNDSIQKIFLGSNGIELEQSNQTYEIGSITKTFVATIYSNLLREKKISLEDEIIDNVTVLQTLTHTSNVREIPFVSTDSNKNGYSGYSKEDVLNYVKTIEIPTQKVWEYSNLGFALAGIYLEDIFKEPFSEIIDRYIRTELKLLNTKVGYNKCSMTGYDYLHHPTNWTWEKNSSIVPAGGLISNIDDMLQYLIVQMKTLGEVCQNTYIKTDMPFDMGLAWMIEKESSSIFCMGLTDGFSSFIGFNKEAKKGIVILSNYFSQGYGVQDTPNQIGLDYLSIASN